MAGIRLQFVTLIKNVVFAYETSGQDLRDLNEPYTNINDGLGIFSGFASQEVYFNVFGRNYNW